MFEALGSIGGSLISSIASIFGGQSKEKAAQQQAAMNLQAQKDFAQQGIVWKAQDATNAEAATGINRLALLGVPTTSFSNITGDTGAVGDAMSSAGQSLGRAVAAATSANSRAAQLEEKLTEAKIANVNADTVRMQAAASAIATKLAQPGTPPGVNVPFPTADPRGPVQNLVQRFRDPRTGEIVWLPSEKAASPLQTIAASPTNAALAGRSLTEGLIGFDHPVSGGAARASSDVGNFSSWIEAP